MSNKKNKSSNIQVQQASFSGPIPHPQILQKYNEIVPDAAARIIKMAENQATHRQDLEKTVDDFP
ncbi:MAG: DUF2335 domain-containing protein [bacterium]